MKILHLEASIGWGGQEIRILKESEGMRAKGHEIILGVQKKGALIQQARNAGFTVYEIDFRKPFWLISFFYLFYLIKRHKIDVVNTHSSLDAWLGGIVAKTASIPVIRTRHLSTIIKPGLNSRILYGILADFIVTTSSSILPMIINQAKRDPQTCRLVATGVDIGKMTFDPKTSEEFRSHLNILPTDLLVGTVCFARSWKGIDDFLNAALLLRQSPDIKWVLIGGGHLEKYRKKAEILGLNGIVHFTGHLTNPLPGIGALDIFTLLSTAHEGISQAMLQAAFLKKPLLSTPIGGLQEVCIHEKTGLQVAPFSPDQIVKAILKYKENPDLRISLGLEAHQLVRSQFTFEQTIHNMEEIYHLVGKKI